MTLIAVVRRVCYSKSRGTEPEDWYIGLALSIIGTIGMDQESVQTEEVLHCFRNV